MEKFQEKANKLFSDVIVHKKSRKKEMSSFQNQTKSGTVETEVKVTDIELLVSRCSYCTKVYKDSKYLIKHLFRRHTEKLLDLHRNLLTLTKSDNDSASSLLKMLTIFLEKEFSELKTKIDGKVSENGHNVDGTVESCVHFDKITEDVNECEIRDKRVGNISNVSNVNEIKELSLKCAETENIIKNLQEQFDNMLQIVGDNVSLKDDYDEKLNLKEQSIIISQTKEISKLKSSLECELQEMKDIFQNHLYQQSFESRKQFSKLQHDFSLEIQRLKQMIESNTQKLNSPESLNILEKKFERQLKYFLGAKKPRKKRVRTALSVADCPEVVPMSSSARTREPTKKNKGIIKSADCHFEEAKRVCEELKKNPDLLNSSAKELSYLVQDKMDNFNVPSKSNRIPCSQFEKKIRLVNCEKELLAAKHNEFLKLRSELDSAVHKMAVSRIYGKSEKKISFAEPLSEENNRKQEKLTYVKNLKGDMNKSVRKQVSTGFIISDSSGHPLESFTSRVTESVPQHIEPEVIVESAFSTNSVITSECTDSANSVLENDVNVTKSDISSVKENVCELDLNSSLESLSSWDEEDFMKNFK